MSIFEPYKHKKPNQDEMLDISNQDEQVPSHGFASFAEFIRYSEASYAKTNPNISFGDIVKSRSIENTNTHQPRDILNETFYQEKVDYAKENSVEEVKETSLFQRTLMNLKKAKSYSNQEKKVQSSGLNSSSRGFDKSNSFTYRRKSSFSSTGDKFKSDSLKEILDNIENSKEAVLKQGNPQNYKTKISNLFSTPKIPFGEINYSKNDQTAAKKTLSRSRSTSNMLSGRTKTPRNSVSLEHIITVTENRANEVGLAIFNIVTGEIFISQVKLSILKELICLLDI